MVNLSNNKNKDTEFSENMEFLLARANAVGVSIKVIEYKKIHLIVAKRNGRVIAIYNDKLPLNPSGAARISKDKNLTKIALKEAGIRVPNGILISELGDLSTILKKAGLLYPLVVKPNNEALGSGVIANIPNFESLEKSCKKVLTGRENALIEDYFDGVDHRFLVLDGKVLAVARRVKPRVIGDGEHTVRELVNAYNQGRIRKVPFDAELNRYLAMQELRVDTIVKSKVEVTLRGNSNYRTGGRSIDVTESVPNFYKEIAVKAAEVLGMRLSGVDILIKDLNINEPNNYIVTEVNSVPGFDVHLYPDEGKGRAEVLDKIWDQLLS